MPDEGEFVGIATDAGALKACPTHPGVVVNQEDEAATRLAYATATNRWKAGLLLGAREEIMDSVKNAIEQAID